MASREIINAIANQKWIESSAKPLQEAVRGAFVGDAGRDLKNFLHGVWLGHPLHPALTDIPLGAWTTAVICDALEEITSRKEFGKAADVAVTVGLVGAVGAALTGLTDWSDTDGRARKVGAVHGMLNLGGAL